MQRRLRPAVLACALVALCAVSACDSDQPSPAGTQGGVAGAAQPLAGTAGMAQGGGALAGAPPAPAGAAGDEAMAGGGAGPHDGGAGGAGAGAAGAPPIVEPQVLATTGATQQVHDPFIIKEGDTFYLFSTGVGISVRTSPDLKSWKGAGSAFASKPAWVTTTDPNNENHLWAPEVRYFGGQFHLYYSASKFGSNQSCIGHATRASLGSGASWVDQGEPVICSNMTGEPDYYNAIDPSPFADESGKLWLSFGSFWGGLKLIRLDADGRRDGPDFFSLATRANNAVEAPQLHYRDGFYYLFESVDSCCQGVNSSYKLMVGRSSSVTGPYLDQAGVSLLDGGGSLLLAGSERYRGPGHNAILVDRGRHYNVYHAYDANNGGAPVLRIAEMIWGDDGWPRSAGP